MFLARFLLFTIDCFTDLLLSDRTGSRELLQLKNLFFSRRFYFRYSYHKLFDIKVIIYSMTINEFDFH